MLEIKDDDFSNLSRKLSDFSGTAGSGTVTGVALEAANGIKGGNCTGALQHFEQMMNATARALSEELNGFSDAASEFQSMKDETDTSRADTFRNFFDNLGDQVAGASDYINDHAPLRTRADKLADGVEKATSRLVVPGVPLGDTVAKGGAAVSDALRVFPQVAEVGGTALAEGAVSLPAQITDLFDSNNEQLSPQEQEQLVDDYMEGRR